MNDGKIIIDKIIADADEAVKKIISEAKEAADITIGAAEDKAVKEKLKNDKLVAEEKEKAAARRLQATLLSVQEKRPVFFNITQFESLGLVRAHGKTLDNTTNWVLTEKAKSFLNVTI